VDLRRVRASDWAAGFCGAALVGLLWAPWYRVAAQWLYLTGSVKVTKVFRWADLNAWQSMAVNDVIFFIAGLLGIWVVVATATHSTAAVPIAADVFAALIGMVASLLAVIRLIWPPDVSPGPTHRAVGVWLGTAAVLGMTFAALVAMRSERRGEGTEVNVRSVPAPQL
jgi:hypothetical protein